MVKKNIPVVKVESLPQGATGFLLHLVWMFFGTSCFKESVPEPLERKRPPKRIVVQISACYNEKGECKRHIVTILNLTPATLVLTTSFWGGRKSSTEGGVHHTSEKKTMEFFRK